MLAPNRFLSAVFFSAYALVVGGIFVYTFVVWLKEALN